MLPLNIKEKNYIIMVLKKLLAVGIEDITFKRVVFAFLRRVSLINAIKRIQYWSPLGFSKINREKIKKFKNCHAGKRCFVIANGPSLKNIDFSFLKNEITIGMNRIYMMEKSNGFMPNYLVCMDIDAQIMQFHKEYDKINIPCFYNYDLHSLFSKKENQCFIKETFSPKFNGDIERKFLGCGKSVAYTCLQLAFYMGFKEVYIIGKDHNYNTAEKPGECLKSHGNEDNHFIKGYYEKGQKWIAPDYKGEEYAYALAKKAYGNNNRIIKDATVNGNLKIFEKIDYYTLF